MWKFNSEWYYLLPSLLEKKIGGWIEVRVEFRVRNANIQSTSIEYNSWNWDTQFCSSSKNEVGLYTRENNWPSLVTYYGS